MPLERIRKHYPVDFDGFLKIALNALLVSNNNRNVLIDPGCADFLPGRLKESYGLEMPFDLEEALVEKGIEPDQITDVIFTHLHFDHGSGAFIRTPGLIEKLFQNARYHVLRRHFTFASKRDAKEAGSFFGSFLKYLDKIHWLENWDEDWMQFLEFDGHAKAMVVPVIQSGKRKIYFASDLVPMELFVEPDVNSAYDKDPDLALKEKLIFLKGLEKNSELILFHDPLKSSIFYP